MTHQVGDRRETTMGYYTWDGRRMVFTPYTDADGEPLRYRYWRSKPGVYRHGDHYLRSEPPDKAGIVPVSHRATFSGETHPPYRVVLDTLTGGRWHPDRFAEYDEIPETDLPATIRREFTTFGPTVFSEST